MSASADVMDVSRKKGASTSRLQLLKNNSNLARRLSQKSIALRKVREVLRQQKQLLLAYKRYICTLTEQRDSLQDLLHNITTEAKNLSRKCDNIDRNLFKKDDVENMSFLANTSLLQALQKSVGQKRKRPLPSKPRNRVVNTVRPMKYGYVVGNPVVSLRRLRQNSHVIPEPLPNLVEEDEDEEEEEAAAEEEEEEDGESENTSETTLVAPDEIAPTPSGLPSPSSPEAASIQQSGATTTESLSVTSDNEATSSARLSNESTAAQSPEELQEDSIKRTGTKGRPRKSVPSSAKKRRTPNFQPKKSTSSKCSVPAANTSSGLNLSPAYSISKTQQQQLLTPCRVMIKNLSINSSSQSFSPKTPVIVLEHITKRKRNKVNASLADVTETEENSVLNASAVSGIDPLDTTGVDLANNITLRRLHRHERPPSAEPVVPLYQKPDWQQQQMEDMSSDEEEEPVKMKLPSPLKMPVVELTNNITLRCHQRHGRSPSPVPYLPSCSDDEGEPLKTKPPSPSRRLDKEDENKKFYSKSSNKHKLAIPDSSFDSDDSHYEKSKKRKRKQSDPDYDPMLFKEKPSKQPVAKKVKPMPLSKKRVLDEKSNTSDKATKCVTARVKCADKVVHPKAMNLKTLDEGEEENTEMEEVDVEYAKKNSDSSSDSSYDEVDPPSQNGTHEYTSLDSQDYTDLNETDEAMSPEQHKSFMNEFLDRLRKENPLEGTSKQFEPKKKKFKIMKAKKSLRILQRKCYQESPNNSLKSKPDMDNSWKPKSKPKPLSKQKRVVKKELIEK